jgi:hypothetical protein
LAADLGDGGGELAVAGGDNFVEGQRVEARAGA